LGGELFLIPYDGKLLGSFNPDTTASHNHSMGYVVKYSGNFTLAVGTGYNVIFSNVPEYTANFGGIETAGAWIAVYYLMTY